MNSPSRKEDKLSAASAVVLKNVDFSDAQLARRAQRGDRLAFAGLIERHERVIYNLSFRMLGDADEARDATQATFVKAFLSVKAFDPGRRFYSWLYRIGVNECLNAIRKKQGRMELDDGLVDATRGPAEQFERDELRLHVRAALRRIPANDRVVIILRHYLDRSYREMAEILGIPEKTVKSRLYTARQRLAGLLLPTREIV
jgi:RNA polymerase sigma-70 factor (ECF subfamily)